MRGSLGYQLVEYLHEITGNTLGDYILNSWDMLCSELDIEPCQIVIQAPKQVHDGGVLTGECC